MDAVITDPPYMIGAISTGDASAKASGWADMENSAWWYAEWLKLQRGALKQDGFACVFGNWQPADPAVCVPCIKVAGGLAADLGQGMIGPAGPRQLAADL